MAATSQPVRVIRRVAEWQNWLVKDPPVAEGAAWDESVALPLPVPTRNARFCGLASHCGGCRVVGRWRDHDAGKNFMMERFVSFTDSC
jgi:hypothetical protein